MPANSAFARWSSAPALHSIEGTHLANSAQARKRARQADAHRQRNMRHRTRFRTFIKRVESEVEAGDYESATDAYKEAVPVIDSMVNRGLVHRNKAARHKSRLNHKIKLLAASE